MIPVEDVRFCPWEGALLPVDHDCIAETRPDDDPDRDTP